MSKKRGFSLIEIMLALGISVLVFVAVFHFVSGVYVQQSRIKQVKSYFSYRYGEPYCELTKKINDIVFNQENQINFAYFLSTTTKISSLHYISQNTFVLTADSASTSEADVFIFTVDIHTASTSLIRSVNVGPGIQDSILLDSYLYVANTSVNSHVKVLRGEEHGFIEISNSILPSLGASASLPKKLSIYNKQLILGSEKSNTGPEVFIFPIQQNGGLTSPAKTIELNGQLNQALIGNGNVYIANAADPELTVFDHLFNDLFSYDAPLTLGNGKSLLYLDPFIVFGRTLGSGELSLLERVGTATVVHDTERTYGTVDFIQHLSDKSFLAISANEDKELQFFKVENKKFTHEKDVNISGRVTSYTCAFGHIFLATVINNQPVLLWIKI